MGVVVEEGGGKKDSTVVGDGVSDVKDDDKELDEAVVIGSGIFVEKSVRWYRVQSNYSQKWLLKMGRQ